jgi:3-keto-L-gulonate-6-phosphate decarboxylase
VNPLTHVKLSHAWNQQKKEALNAQFEHYAQLHRSNDQQLQPMLWRQQGLLLPQ